MRKTIIIISFMLLFSALVWADELDAQPGTSYLALLTSCGDPYCATLQDNAYYKQCGDTTYKYWCKTDEKCSGGKCIPRTAPAQTCEVKLLDYYCSTLESGVYYQKKQNADCSTTSYKYWCPTGQVCTTGKAGGVTCIAEVKCQVPGWGNPYCSSLSPGYYYRQYCDTSTGLITSYKYSCGNDLWTCEDGRCKLKSVIHCQDKEYGRWYCEDSYYKAREVCNLLTGSKSVEKQRCDSGKVCQNGECWEQSAPTPNPTEGGTGNGNNGGTGNGGGFSWTAFLIVIAALVVIYILLFRRKK